MKKHIVVSCGIGDPASAAMNCGPARVEIGDPGAVGVVSTYVAHDPDGKWTIKHTLANGLVVDRSLQYFITDYTGPSALQWRGTLMRNASVSMVGEAMKLTATGQPTYDEWLYQNGKLIMHSVALCKWDRPPALTTQPSVSAPAPLAYAAVAAPGPSLAPAAPAAVAAPPAAAPSGVPAGTIREDSIGILNAGKAVFAQLTVGSLPVMMQIDTGATEMTVSEKVAQALLANGEAETTDDGQVTLADGSRITEKQVIIHDVKIGLHGLRNVVAGVVSNDAGMLLPFPVLNAIGIVTIDTNANKLIFSQPPNTQAVLELPPGFSTTPPKSDLFDASAPPAGTLPAGQRARPAQMGPTPGVLY